MIVNSKGLLGQYAGFVSRAIGQIADVLIVLAIIAIINGSIALTLELFLQVQVTACPPLDWKFDWGTLVTGALLCHAANWLRVFLSLAINPVYFAFFWTLGGQTPGQYLMGVRVVRADGRRMTVLRGLVRWVGLIVSLLPLGLGFLWCLWDDRRQIFADKMAHTVVVYAWDARRNEFRLDRLRNRLRRRKGVRRPAIAAPTPAAAAKPMRLELVQVELPVSVASRGGGAIRVLQDAVRRGDVNIITSTVLVKDENGRVGYVGSSDLAAGDESHEAEAALANDPRLSTLNLETLMGDVPPGSAIWSIITEDKYLVPVLTTLTAAKAAAKVFDLDTPAHGPITIASPGATASADLAAV